MTAAPATPEQIAAYADTVIAAIRKDMAEPFPWGDQIPADLPGFADLHEYCDANDYLMEAVPYEGPECDCPFNRSLQPGHSDDCSTQDTSHWEQWITVTNDVSAEVDRRIKAGVLRGE